MHLPVAGVYEKTNTKVVNPKCGQGFTTTLPPERPFAFCWGLSVLAIFHIALYLFPPSPRGAKDPVNRNKNTNSTFAATTHTVLPFPIISKIDDIG